MATRKPSAADRTIDMFAHKEREIEVLEAEEKADRISIPEDADRLREQAFQSQAWTTKLFGSPEAKGNEYRLTHRGEHYYLEAVSGSRYCGLMIHERDLIAVATVFVGAARKLTGK